MTTKELAIQALQTFQQSAVIAGLPWFLNGGTLLGAVRDGDFCPGDEDDIDIGVFDEDFDRMGQVTEGSWFRVIGRFIYKERIEGVKLELEAGGVHIDVSRFRLNPRTRERYDLGTLNIGGERVFCANVYPAIHWHGFETVDFHGVACQVPSAAEALLESRYGPKWRNPIHRQDFDWIRWLPFQQCVKTDYECL